MPTEIASQIGSGTQDFRQVNFQKNHKPATAAHIVNWEDSSAVQAIRTSGFDVVANSTRIPSGVYNLPGRRVLAIYNNGNDPVFIGQSGITSSTGFPLASGASQAFAIAANLDMWAVTASGKVVNIRTMEMA